jgi:hypothetical protein
MIIAVNDVAIFRSDAVDCQWIGLREVLVWHSMYSIMLFVSISSQAYH